MRYERISLSALGAAVALACGGVSAQDREPADRLEAAEQRAETAQQQAESADERAEIAEQRAEEAEDAREDAEELAGETAEQDPGDAEDLAQQRDELLQSAEQGLQEVLQEHPSAATLYEEAYGYAVFDTTKGGFIVTGEGGTGVAQPKAGGEPVFMHLGGAGIGLGAGLENYKLVLLFQNEQTYNDFVSGQWDGSISAQAAAGESGVAAEEQFVEGIMTYRTTDGGLMAQVDITGTRFWASDRLNQPGFAGAQRVASASGGGAQGGGASSRQEQGNPERLDELTQEHENLSTFVEAVKAAGLADSLTGSTSYTVFAPTDEAFESMSEDVQSLLEPQNREQLVELLRAHIVADDVDQEMARTISEARTIDGGTIDISSEDDRIMIGEAGVVEPSIQSGNLRVYAIDQVLSQGTQLAAADPEEPAGADVTDEPTSETESPAQGRPAAEEEPSTLR